MSEHACAHFSRHKGGGEPSLDGVMPWAEAPGGEREPYTSMPLSLCLLTGAPWHQLPNPLSHMISYTCKQWAKRKLPFLSCFCHIFCASYKESD